MTFANLQSVLYLIPAALLCYYISPKKAKNGVLLAAGVLFCGWVWPLLLPALVLAAAVNYVCARGLDRFDDRPPLRRLLLALAILATLGAMGGATYFSAFLEGSRLGAGDIGASLCAFGIALHLLSYTLDVFRRQSYAEKNLLRFGVFAFFLPQLAPGLVVRYRDIDCAIETRQVLAGDLEAGAEQFIIGLAQVSILAESLATLYQNLLAFGIESLSTGLAWLMVVAFGLSLYFQLSGWARMAIGLGRMLGFCLPQNFDHPYASRSMTDFGRRWYLTLSRWLRDYLYFPMGGSRQGFMRTALNLLIVWLATGLFYGFSLAHTLWSILMFVLIMIERMGLRGFLNRHRVFSFAYMALALPVTWSLFMSPNLPWFGTLIYRMFVPTSLTGAVVIPMWHYLFGSAGTLIVAGFFSAPIASRLYEKLCARRWLRNLLLILLFLLSIAFLVNPERALLDYLGF